MSNCELIDRNTYYRQSDLFGWILCNRHVRFPGGWAVNLTPIAAPNPVESGMEHGGLVIGGFSIFGNLPTPRIVIAFSAITLQQAQKLERDGWSLEYDA